MVVDKTVRHPRIDRFIRTAKIEQENSVRVFAVHLRAVVESPSVAVAVGDNSQDVGVAHPLDGALPDDARRDAVGVAVVHANEFCIGREGSHKALPC